VCVCVCTLSIFDSASNHVTELFIGYLECCLVVADAYHKFLLNYINNIQKVVLPFHVDYNGTTGLRQNYIRCL